MIEVPVWRPDHAGAFQGSANVISGDILLAKAKSYGLAEIKEWGSMPGHNRKALCTWVAKVEEEELRQLSDISHWDWDITLTTPCPQLILSTLKFGNYRLCAGILSTKWNIWGLKKILMFKPQTPGTLILWDLGIGFKEKWFLLENCFPRRIWVSEKISSVYLNNWNFL